MFKKLHLQFTFFCTLITSMILIGMSLFYLGVVESQTKNESYISFHTNINSIFTYLEGQSIISNQWIIQMESSYQLRLFIRDNGVPLFYDTLNQDPSVEQAALQAEEISRTKYGLDLNTSKASAILSRHQEFTMQGNDGEDYYVSAAMIPRGDGHLSIVALHSLKTETQNIWRRRLIFAGADFIAMILLGIFSFFFTRRMIRPIQANRQKQVQFIASASHELRSPLTVMLSSLSAMKIATPSESKRFSDTIWNEGQRMSHLIDDMLALANADSHNWVMHPGTLELDTLLLQTYEKYEPIAFTKGISFDVELPEAELAHIQGDGERLAQVLSILVDNAFSYTPQGGRVVISLEQEKDRVQIRVADNGPGIEDEKKELIFDRFYRADQSHKDKEHFGLGLCIAREIIRLHKGTIQVVDTPGGGATFLVQL